MLYNRNKKSFKKTTVKAQHHLATSNILSLIRQTQSSRQQQTEENQPIINDPIKIIKAENQLIGTPKMCESIYKSQKKLRNFEIKQVYELNLRSREEENIRKQVERFSTSIKEQRQKSIELNALNKNKESDCESNKESCEDKDKQKYQRFYHKSRNLVLTLLSQLIEVKNQVRSKEKVEEINRRLREGEELLDVYRSIMENGTREKEKHTYEELEEICKHQQGKIEFLSKKFENPINEVKLLRHQITRIFNDNQCLLKKIQLLKNENLDEVQSDQKQVKDVKQMQENTKRIMEQKEKLKIEKQCLMDFLEEQKNKNEQLEARLAEYGEQVVALRDWKDKAENIERDNRKFQSQIWKLEEELKSCKRKMDGESFGLLEEKKIQTTEQLCRVLQPYPQYFRLFTLIVSEYEQKICKLQEQLSDQKLAREKLLDWTYSIYNIIQRNNYFSEEIDKHLQQFNYLQSNWPKTNIDKLLTNIRALSIGIDENQILQMEQELEEYIVSLKGRNQVIKQVLYEDGSSVASDAFTENDFQ